MDLWRQLKHGLRALTDRGKADQDIADEVQHYLEQAAAAGVKAGMAPEEALRAARLELGSVAGVREEVRGYGWENALETLWGDLRHAARRLRSEPVFTAIAALTLALGIGGTTAIFSVVSPILFETLPYPQAGRIAMIWEHHDDGRRADGTFGMFRELRTRSRTLESVAAYKPWQPTRTGTEQPERLDGQRVSADYFEVLGVAPALGRGFLASEDVLHGPDVVVLGEGLWRRRYGADPSIVGQAVTLDGKSSTVVGVMPAGFENVPGPTAEVWAPLQYGLAQGRAWGHHLRLVARLRPGVGVDEATRELEGLGRAVLEELKPETYGEEVDLAAVSLQEDVTRGVKPALLAILGAVALVLAIACVNVTNLLLTRGVQRRGELALRAALGAGRGRLIRQLMTESLLLAALGGAAGLGLAAIGVRALVAISPPELPRLAAIRVDGAVFAFALGITVLVGLAFGLLPAWQAARQDPQSALQQGSRRTAGGHARARGLLVVAEVALALVLLVCSGLLLRSLERLFAVSPGFEAGGLLTLQVQTAGPRYAEDEARHRFFEQALEAVRGVPGVTAAALTSQLPLSGDLDAYGVHFEASPGQRADEDHTALRYGVSPGYLETMGIPLRAGRTLGEQDRAGAPLAALINESYAKRVFRGVDPLGQRLRVGPMDGEPYTVVGVVGDVKQMSLALGPSEAVYTTTGQWRFADRALSLVVRARGEPEALAAAVRQAVWSVDGEQPVVRLATMEALLAASAAERRFALLLFEAFALTALLLAAAGVYGVISGSVAERTRELGVRLALGATRLDVLRLVVREGLRLTGLGVALGLLAAAAATRTIAALLFGVSPLDPITYLGVVALLAGVSLAACGAPAWRAARIDPANTLRAE